VVFRGLGVYGFTGGLEKYRGFRGIEGV